MTDSFRHFMLMFTNFDLDLWLYCASPLVLTLGSTTIEHSPFAPPSAGITRTCCERSSACTSSRVTNGLPCERERTDWSTTRGTDASTNA